MGRDIGRSPALARLYPFGRRFWAAKAGFRDAGEGADATVTRSDPRLAGPSSGRWSQRYFRLGGRFSMTGLNRSVRVRPPPTRAWRTNRYRL